MSSSSSYGGWIGALSTAVVMGSAYCYYQSQTHNERRYNGELDGPLLAIHQAKNDSSGVKIHDDYYGPPDSDNEKESKHMDYPSQSVVHIPLPHSGCLEHPRTKDRYHFVEKETLVPLRSLTASLKINTYEHCLSSLLQLKHVMLLQKKTNNKNKSKEHHRFYIHQDQVTVNVLSSDPDAFTNLLFICKVEEAGISGLVSVANNFYLYIMLSCFYDVESKVFKTVPHTVRLDQDTDVSFAGGLLNVNAGSYDVTQQQVKFPYSPVIRNEFSYENVIRLVRYPVITNNNNEEMDMSTSSLMNSIYTVLQRPVEQSKRFGLPYILSNVIPSHTLFTMYFPWWNASDECTLIFESPLRVIDGNQVTSPVLDRSQASIFYLQINNDVDDGGAKRQQKMVPFTLYDCHRHLFLNDYVRQYVLMAKNATDYIFEFKVWLIKTEFGAQQQQQQHNENGDDQEQHVVYHRQHQDLPIMNYILMIKQRPTVKTMMMTSEHDRDFVYGDVYVTQSTHSIKEVLQFQLQKQVYTYHVEMKNVTSETPHIKLELVS